MTVCLFRGPPRPVPGPKGNRTVPADGISVIADAAGDYQIDGSDRLLVSTPRRPS